MRRAREGVPALVQADRIETCSPPRGQSALAHRRRRERLRRARAEDEASVATRDELVLDEKIAERRDDRNTTAPGAALRPTGLAVAAHAALDADQAVGEVDVLPDERAKLAAAQAGVESAAPERAVIRAKGCDQCDGFRWRGDALAAAARSRQPKPLARIDGEVAVFDRAPVDHLERLERVPDRARIGAGGEQLIGEPLDVASLDPREPRAAERGEDVEAKRALVLAHDQRLVPLAASRPNGAGGDPIDEGLCGLEERLRCTGETNTLRRLLMRPSAPATSLGKRFERLRDLPLADRVVRRHAIAGAAVAALAVSRGARAGVTDFDPLGYQPPRARVDARSNQRSSSASATRIRRPRRTIRSSSMTCSSK